MKADEMIDYVLGQVDGAERERLERALRDDDASVGPGRAPPATIYRLLDDGTPFEHPPGLAERTVAFVARNRRRARAWSDFVPMRVPFRWADLAVAAGIFLAGVLTLLPAIQRSRERMNQAGCVFNLQQLGNSFGQYATVNQLMPYPPSSRDDASAGSFAAMLHDAGVLDDAKLLDCPCNGPCTHASHELVGFDQLEHIRRTDPARYQHLVSFDYAYNIGYHHAPQHPGPLDFSAFLAGPGAGRPAQPRRLRRSRPATARTTPAAGRTSSSATAACGGSAPATSAPATRTSTSTTPTSPGRASTRATRCWFPATPPFRGW